MGKVTIPIKNHQDGAVPLKIPADKCIDPDSYRNALKALKKACPDVANFAYMTDGFEFSDGDMKAVGECGQAEYKAQGHSMEEHNEGLLKCLKSSKAARSVAGLDGGKEVRKALIKAVDKSIPTWWEKYSGHLMYGGGTLLTFFLFGAHAIEAWKNFFKKGPPTGTSGTDNPVQKATSSAADTATKMVATGLALIGALVEAARRMPPPAPQVEPACKHPSGFCPTPPELDTDLRRHVVYYTPAPDFGRIAKAAALTVFTAAAAIFGPKVMPKGLLNPQTAPAGFGGFGITPRGNRGTPEVL